MFTLSPEKSRAFSVASCFALLMLPVESLFPAYIPFISNDDGSGRFDTWPCHVAGQIKNGLFARFHHLLCVYGPTRP